MQTHPSEIRAAAEKLSRSTAGMHALRCLLHLFKGRSLDSQNKANALALINAFFDGSAGTVIEECAHSLTLTGHAPIMTALNWAYAACESERAAYERRAESDPDALCPSWLPELEAALS